MQTNLDHFIATVEKLSLVPGDTLFVRVPVGVSEDKMRDLQRALAAATPEGVKGIILCGTDVQWAVMTEAAVRKG